jgi:acrylyl-CoA reductase (NADPH)
MYKALVIRAYKNIYQSAIELQKFPILAKNEVLIKVKYSSLNYKDCLSIAGHKGITRTYPHIPGIDAAGIVVASKSNKFIANSEVIVTGYDLGMNLAGGFAEYVKVPANWVIHKPKELTLKQAMLFGTAGFTAMSSYLQLKNHFKKLQNKRILITGVSGGVGLISTLILAQQKANLILATRKIKNHPLANMATTLINSSNLLTTNAKPLLNRNYDGVIDNLGGTILENIIKQTEYDGLICSCGNVTGANLEHSIYPFILRAVTLKGISSANTKYKLRQKIWLEIAKFQLWTELENFITEVSLDQISTKANLMLAGKHQGRFLVKL